MIIGEYLSTGFKDVDRTNDREAYFSCLALLDSLPYYRESKQKSYQLLKLKPGMTVLEAGCGLGDDAVRIAELVMPGGNVVALDASTVMIEKARSRNLPAYLSIHFQTGDVKALPFSDHSFSRCRIDRVLQHVLHPEKAISELVRVLEPGGLILAYDNDWGTFSIRSDHTFTRSLERFWCDSFTNCRIGRDLRDLFISCGLSDIDVHRGTSVIEDLETADKIYNLRETARKASAQGVISVDQGLFWIEELIDRSGRGRFSATLTAYTVVGQKRYT